MSKTCPACSRPASGRFCSHCGASLDAEAKCAECGQEIPTGVAFCSACGAPAEGAGPAAPSTVARVLPWLVAGAALVGLVVVTVLPRAESAPSGPGAMEAPFASGAPAAGQGAMPSAEQIANMDPREAADRLFNRVMQAVEQGDSGQAKMFQPMALSAYSMVGTLDNDARYHVAILDLVGGDAAGAGAQADTILAKEPKHLLALFTKAQAEEAQGNAAQARQYYQRFLESYDGERTRDLPEYQDHARILPTLQEQAKKAVGGA